MPSARVGLLGALALGFVLAMAAPAGAHPLGNFTVNQYSGLVVRSESVDVDYVLDMAEIPTFQARPGIDADGDGTLSAPEAAAYARSTCSSVAGRLTLTADGSPLALVVGRSVASFPVGQAGLATTRVMCAMTAPVALGGDASIAYRNANFDDRIGWREITVAGDRTTVSGSDAPTTSVSARLTTYPKNALSSPPDERAVSFHVRPGGAPLAATPTAPRSDAGKQPRGVDAATRAFTDYVGRTRLTVPVAIVAFLLATVLGAIHAFAPGHGKTVMAAYLVGRHGSLRQASLIALTVTATHTAGVLLLGILISASTVIAPERLYPWLGAISGGLLIAIGATMLRGRRRVSSLTLAADVLSEPAVAQTRALVTAGVGASLTDHGRHDHGSHHGSHHEHVHDDHHDHAHPHDHDHHHHEPTPVRATPEPHRHGGRWHTHTPPPVDGPLRPAGLLAMGFVGGLLPSPSALVVLLGAIALHRAWFGVILVAAYGAGMALTLTGAGLLLVRGRVAIDRHLRVGRRLPALLMLERVLPSLTGLVVVAVGTFLTAKGVLAIR